MPHSKTKEEFLDLLEKNQDTIHKICFVYLRNRADREDLFQEIVFQLWKSFPTFRAESSFSTWLYRVALNTTLSNLKRIKKQRHIEKDRLLHNPLHVTQDEKDMDQVRLLYQAIEKLNELDKAIILLHLEEKGYDEIAMIMGITSKNVGVRLVRIREKLERSVNQLIKSS